MINGISLPIVLIWTIRFLRVAETDNNDNDILSETLSALSNLENIVEDKKAKGKENRVV